MSARIPCRAPRGFSLIEMMIALTLGLLLGIGIITLFDSTSRISKAQNAMAVVQENGRYAMQRITGDLRLAGRQLYSAGSYLSTVPGTRPLVSPGNAPEVYVASLTLPDNGGAVLSKSTTSLFGGAAWTVSGHWPLSPVTFMRGYECSTASACTPALPTGMAPNGFPTPGTDATSGANRVKGTDVLSVRYLDAAGWSLSKGEIVATCSSGMLTQLSVVPLASGGAATNFVAGNLAMLVVAGSASIFQVNVSGAAGASQVLTPQNVVGTSNAAQVPNCPVGGSSEAVLYNFSRDFATVSYYLALDADPNVSGRYIPALHRRRSDNTAGGNVSDDELVQGVERMDFLYGVQWQDGSTTFLTADQIENASFSNAANCPLPPYQYITNSISGESNCLWRAVKSIEVHLLLDSIDNTYTLTPADLAYQYQGSSTGAFDTTTVQVPGAATATDAVTGLKVGSMVRREFVSLVSVRNYNP